MLQGVKKSRNTLQFSSGMKSYKANTQNAPECDSIRGKEAKILAVAYRFRKTGYDNCFYTDTLAWYYLRLMNRDKI